MARVIHATTMKPTIAKACCVAGASGEGTNHTASGTRMQSTWPTITSGEFGSSSDTSPGSGAGPAETVTMSVPFARTLSWPDLFRPSRRGWQGAYPIEIAGAPSAFALAIVFV
jgi:hypothetical protein